MPACESGLSWKNHVKRWEQGREVSEFTFLCESCKGEYLFKDDQVIEKRLGRDHVAETIAIQHGQLQDVLQRRCPNCGGPVVQYKQQETGCITVHELMFFGSKLSTSFSLYNNSSQSNTDRNNHGKKALEIQ